MNTRLFHGDGQTFSEGPSEEAVWHNNVIDVATNKFWVRQKRKKLRLVPRKKPTKRLKDNDDGTRKEMKKEEDNEEGEEGKMNGGDERTSGKEPNLDERNSQEVETEKECPPSASLSQSALYDKVLVDAECTHDGSIRHVLKYDTWGWDTLKKRVLDQERLTNLQTLQRNLIRNGYRMLKPGGRLVYSTCSFIEEQNEGIVSWLLEEMKGEATLVPVHTSFSNMFPAWPRMKDAESESEESGSVAEHRIPFTEGTLPGTAHFDPLVSNTSGLFVSIIEKAAACHVGAQE